jgi:hypothetical protein
VHGADRTQRHPTSRSSGHRVPDPCDHPRSSALGGLLLPWSSSLPAMPHLLPAHHETSKHDSLHETKIKVKQQKCPWFEFKPLQVNDSSQSNQGTDHLVSQSPLDESIDNKKHKVWSSNPKSHEAQLEEQKATKSSRRSSEEGKNHKANERQEKWQIKEKSKKSSNSKTHHKSNSPYHSQCKLSSLGKHYYVYSLNHPISKSSTNFVNNLSPFDNELIKHNLREERDAMYEIKIRVLHKAYKQVFKQLYTPLCQDL